MTPKKYSGLITCVAAAGIGMFVAMWLLDFSVVRSDWCNGAETKCFREWIGVLSGWIAAAGALTAALLTLPHLKQQVDEAKKQAKEARNQAKEAQRQADEARRQADEARRQTDFIVGDALPSLEISIDTPFLARFNLQNLNRRRIEVLEIENLCNFPTAFRIKTAGGQIVQTADLIVGQSYSIDRMNRLFVDGNIRPNEAPQHKVIELFTDVTNEAITERTFGIKLKIKLRDEKGSTFELRATDTWKR